MSRRDLGRQVAEAKRRRRALLGAPAILAELAPLEEAARTRRLLADEQRVYDRLRRELDALPSEPLNGVT